MELHQLRYVAMVAQTGNFSRAASLCHVAQPSLSQQVKKLEEELGQCLFLRSKQGAQLTRFGRQLLPKIQEILAGVTALENQSHALQHEISGELILGAIPTIAPYLMPVIVQVCGRAHPRMHLNLMEDTTDILVDKLLSGDLDYAVMSRPHPHDDLLETHTLFQDPLLISLSAKHSLAKRKRLRINELTETPMIIMHEMHCLSGQSRALCEASAVQPKVSIESAQIETMVSLVESGMGYSLIPQIAAESLSHRNVVFRKLDSKDAYRDIILAWPKARPASRLMQAFQHVVTQIPLAAS